MFQPKIIFLLVIAVLLIEPSTQQLIADKKNGIKKSDANDTKIREEMLAAVRRGDIRGFRRGINNGGMKAYADVTNNYSFQRLREVERVMNNKMHAIEMLIATKLAVPASIEQPEQYHFNVSLIPGTDLITQLSLNLMALNRWNYSVPPLHPICNLPDVEPRIVKYVLEKGSDINERLPPYYSPLDLAAMNGNLALVKFLIEKGADLNRTVRNQEEFEGRNYHAFIKTFSPNDLAIRNGTTVYHNALVAAIYGGNINVIKFLISLGMDVNLDNQSWVVLFEPVYDGKKEIVEILLKSGCDVNGRDLTGATALHIAVDKGNLEMAELLLNNGANVTAIDNFGWTPLHVAAFSSHNIAMVELLLEAGGPLQVTTDRGFTPLILAEAGSDPAFLGCLRRAITSNFSMNVSCQRISKACKHQNNIYITALLCTRGADVQHKDDLLGWSTLHWASAIGDENAVRYLVEKCGASNSTRSRAGLYPSDVAKYFGMTSH